MVWTPIGGILLPGAESQNRCYTAFLPVEVFEVRNYVLKQNGRGGCDALVECGTREIDQINCVYGIRQYILSKRERV